VNGNASFVAMLLLIFAGEILTSAVLNLLVNFLAAYF
jgi:hypothetical protein